MPLFLSLQFHCKPDVLPCSNRRSDCFGDDLFHFFNDIGSVFAQTCQGQCQLQGERVPQNFRDILRSLDHLHNLLADVLNHASAVVNVNEDDALGFLELGQDLIRRFNDILGSFFVIVLD